MKVLIIINKNKVILEIGEPVVVTKELEFEEYSSIVTKLSTYICSLEKNKTVNDAVHSPIYQLDIVTKRIINKILHHPTIELRKADEGSNSVDSSTKIGIIRDLFGINSKKKIEKD